ncbi:MAG: 16S rRNA (guanine(527)-N(7))-methyltransferase RsmG [bacterium]
MKMETKPIEINIDDCFKHFDEIGLQLSDYQLQQFKAYYQELLRWNSRINLISKNDENRIVERHFLESCALSFFDEFIGQRLVLDLGSGGGFPGVPLKILNPNLILILLDSKRKKVLFLKNLIEKLKLEQTGVLCLRAEDAGQMSEYQNRFDIVLARAVAELSKLYEWAQPFLKPEGLLVAMKGSNWEAELRALELKWPQLSVKVESLPIKTSKSASRQKIVFIRNGLLTKR